MAVITVADVLDLVKGTLNDLGSPKFQQIAQTLTKYEVMSKWLKKDKMVFDDGKGIQRNLMTKLGGAASHAGLFSPDNVDVPDLMSQLNIPWRHAKTYWAMERREALMNRGKALVFNVIEPRRAGAMIDMADILENGAWSVPSTSNTTEPYGIPYYVVKSASTGFNGGNPGSFSTCAGIDSTTTPSWKNYTYQYTTVNKPDLLKGMRTGYRKTGWISPVDINDYRNGQGKDCRYYTNETVIASLEDVGEAQNENLGRDIAPMDADSGNKGKSGIGYMDGDFLTFRRHPIIWVAKLDEDTQNPVYQIDHTVFYPVCLKGDYLVEDGPMKDGKSHNTLVTHVDLTYNFLVVDRRRLGVYATA